MSHGYDAEDRTSLHNPVLFSRDSELDAQLRTSEGAVVQQASVPDPAASSVVSSPLPKPPASPSAPASTASVSPPTPPATPPRPAYEGIITQTDRHGTPTAPPRSPSPKPRSSTSTDDETATNGSEASSDDKKLRPSTSGQTTASSSRSSQGGKKSSCCWCLFWCCDGEDELNDEWKNKERESELPTRKTPRKPDRYRSVKLLSAPVPKNAGRKCLVLDLDETLVHSSFQAIPNPDYIIPVTINNIVYSVYVLKRPGVDEFLKRMGEVFEIVLFTASLSKYADPLLNELDTGKVIDSRLFREHCVLHDGHYVKDLSLLNRDISQTIIVDNSPLSYFFQPENAIDCFSYIDDPTDVELWEIADFLENIKDVKDVRLFCKTWKEWCKNNPNSSVPKNKRVSSTTSI